jgi:hypothetical protein
MPGRRYVIGSPDQAQIGIRPDGPQDLAQPGQRSVCTARPPQHDSGVTAIPFGNACRLMVGHPVSEVATTWCQVESGDPYVTVPKSGGRSTPGSADERNVHTTVTSRRTAI